MHVTLLMFYSRAKFSEITQISVDRAVNNLEQPNKAISDAVDVRSELDLRIGNKITYFVEKYNLAIFMQMYIVYIFMTYRGCIYKISNYETAKSISQKFGRFAYKLWTMPISYTRICS